VIFRKDFHIFPPRSDEIPLGISRALRGIYIDKDETQGHSLECHRAPLGALRGWTAALISVFIYRATSLRNGSRPCLLAHIRKEARCHLQPHRM
jgi:hypothetical protein